MSLRLNASVALSILFAVAACNNSGSSKPGSGVPDSERIARSQMTVEEVEAQQAQLSMDGVCTFDIKETFSGEEYKEYSAKASCTGCITTDDCQRKVDRMNKFISDAASLLTENTSLRKTTANRLKALKAAAVEGRVKFENQIAHIQGNAKTLAEALVDFKNKTGVEATVELAAHDDKGLAHFLSILKKPELIAMVKGSPFKLLKFERGNGNADVMPDGSIQLGLWDNSPYRYQEITAEENTRRILEHLSRQPSAEVFENWKAVVSELLQKGIQITTDELPLVESLALAGRINKIMNDPKALITSRLVFKKRDWSWCWHVKDYYGKTAGQLELTRALSDQELLNCLETGDWKTARQ
jgi:hypothetical protein